MHLFVCRWKNSEVSQGYFSDFFLRIHKCTLINFFQKAFAWRLLGELGEQQGGGGQERGGGGGGESYKVCGQTLEMSLSDVKCMKLVKNIKLLGKKEPLYSLDVFYCFISGVEDKDKQTNKQTNKLDSS